MHIGTVSHSFSMPQLITACHACHHAKAQATLRNTRQCHFSSHRACCRRSKPCGPRPSTFKQRSCISHRYADALSTVRWRVMIGWLWAVIGSLGSLLRVEISTQTQSTTGQSAIWLSISRPGACGFFRFLGELVPRFCEIPPSTSQVPSTKKINKSI